VKQQGKEARLKQRQLSLLDAPLNHNINGIIYFRTEGSPPLNHLLLEEVLEGLIANSGDWAR
jgi:hypothetical protein